MALSPGDRKTQANGLTGLKMVTSPVLEAGVMIGKSRLVPFALRRVPKGCYPVAHVVG
jgi:hypothetical protein